MLDFNNDRIILEGIKEKGKNVFEITPEQTGGMSKDNVLNLLKDKLPTSLIQISKIPITKDNVVYTIGSNSFVIKNIPYVIYYGKKYNIKQLLNTGVPAEDGRYAFVAYRNDEDISYDMTILRDSNVNGEGTNPTSLFIKGNKQNGLLLGVWFYITDGKLSEVIINENIGFYGHYDIPYYSSKDNVRNRTNIVMVSDINGDIDYE